MGEVGATEIISFFGKIFAVNVIVIVIIVIIVIVKITTRFPRSSVYRSSGFTDGRFSVVGGEIYLPKIGYKLSISCSRQLDFAIVGGQTWTSPRQDFQ